MHVKYPLRDMNKIIDLFKVGTSKVLTRFAFFLAFWFGAGLVTHFFFYLWTVSALEYLLPSVSQNYTVNKLSLFQHTVIASNGLILIMNSRAMPNFR